MSVRERMADIDTTAGEVFDVGRLHHDNHTARSRRTVYEKALYAVDEVAGSAAMHALADWIEGYIRDRGRSPTGRQVRKRGATICREFDHEVSTGDWLGA